MFKKIVINNNFGQVVVLTGESMTYGVDAEKNLFFVSEESKMKYLTLLSNLISVEYE